MPNLREVLKASMNEMLDVLHESIPYNDEDDDWDYADPEYLEDRYNEFIEEWFEEGEEWWDFPLEELTIANFNELLEDRDSREGAIGRPIDTSSVYKLMRNFGYYIARDDESDTYIQLLKDRICESENNNPTDSSDESSDESPENN